MKKYDKYKDSGFDWVGKIPEHWEIKKVKYCIKKLETGKREKNPNSKDILSIGGEHITSNGKIKIKKPRYVSQNFYDNIKNGKIQRNDILMVKDGATIGKTAFVDFDPNNNMLLNEHVYKIIADKYYYYYFLSHYFQSSIWKENQSSAQEGITRSTILNNFSFFIPSFQEQTAIANFLDRKTAQIDELIAKKESLLELYEEEKNAIINQAVTKGINPDAPMKDSGIEWLDKIPEHWDFKKLKYVTKGIITGKTPPSNNLNYYNGNIDWFTPGDFNSSLFLINSKRKITEQATLEAGIKVYPKNSVLLVGIGATLGKIGITKNTSTSNQQINALIFDEKKVSPYYCLYFLFSFKDAIIRLANSATLAIFNQTQTKEFEIFVPPLKEQTAIVQYIEKEINHINAKSEKTKKLIDLLKEYKQALISEVVTGKIKVI